jgi:Family of unknown function (DUF6516)
MKSLEKEFSSIIKSFKVLQDRKDSKISSLKIRITFINNSVLEATEIKVVDLNKRKYAYHWMDSDLKLIKRWDNAAHHHYISSFPHHIHEISEDNIKESHDISLLEVLKEIRDKTT